MVDLRSLTALARVKVPRLTGLLAFRRGQDVAGTLAPFVIGLFIPPAAAPGGVLMSDDGTGTNGDPWPASNWEAGLNTGSATFDIQSNQLRVTASSTTFATNRVLETLITGQGGAFDITLDYTVSNVAVAHGALITVNGGAGDSDRFEFAHYFHTGTVDLAKVAGFSYSYPGSGSVAVAVADVVHVHMVRDPASGQFDVTMWLNAASEPGTPTISITDTAFPVDRIEFGIYDPSAARTVIYDNIVISSLAAGGGSTWAGSTGTVSVAGTSGSFTPGTAIWAGSTGTVSMAGTSGSFAPGTASWSGSTGTVSITGTSGSFDPGAASWSGSSGDISMIGASGACTPAAVWAGSDGTISMIGTSGSFDPGAASWSGSSGTVSVAGSSGSFDPGTVSWSGGAGTVSVAGTSGVFVPGTVVWSGSSGWVLLAGESGSFTLPGPVVLGSVVVRWSEPSSTAAGEPAAGGWSSPSSTAAAESGGHAWNEPSPLRGADL